MDRAPRGKKIERLSTASLKRILEQILGRRDLTDPRVTYLLHEMGEETRHLRLFVRLLLVLGAQNHVIDK